MNSYSDTRLQFTAGLEIPLDLDFIVVGGGDNHSASFQLFSKPQYNQDHAWED